jgi:hypothetical protein
MKSYSALIALCLGITSFSFAQTLKKVLELQMPEGEGTRGASVVYHTTQKKYYASFAGNAVYPMAVFDLKGKRLSGDSLTTQFDTRGLWYNTANQTIYANGYNDAGWMVYELDSKGIPSGILKKFDGIHQPGEQSVGTYNSKTNQVYFLSGRNVVGYNAKTAETVKELQLLIKDDGEEADSILLPEKYNQVSLVFTGIPKAEIGLLNITDSQIELFDLVTGTQTKQLKLPSDAPKETMFNFAYANGIYWLFSIGKRTWIGYK